MKNRELLEQLVYILKKKYIIKKDLKNIMKSFLIYASESPDNINCFKNIEYSKSSNNRYEFVLKKYKLPVIDLIDAIDLSNIPNFNVEKYSSLKIDEWKSSIILCKILFMVFSKDIIEIKEDKFLFSILNFINNDFINKKDLEGIMDSLKNSYSYMINNLEISNFIDYNNSFDGDNTYEFIIKGKNIPIIDIIDLNYNLPQNIKLKYPKLKINEWEACINIATKLFLILQKFFNIIEFNKEQN